MMKMQRYNAKLNKIINVCTKGLLTFKERIPYAINNRDIATKINAYTKLKQTILKKLFIILPFAFQEGCKQTTLNMLGLNTQ